MYHFSFSTEGLPKCISPEGPKALQGIYHFGNPEDAKTRYHLIKNHDNWFIIYIILFLLLYFCTKLKKKKGISPFAKYKQKGIPSPSPKCKELSDWSNYLPGANQRAPNIRSEVNDVTTPDIQYIELAVVSDRVIQ